MFPRLLIEGRRFDLAFLDGNHRFEAVFLDLIHAGRLLKEGGIVFVDDTQLEGVRRAVEFCVTNLGWTIEDAGEERSQATHGASCGRVHRMHSCGPLQTSSTSSGRTPT